MAWYDYTPIGAADKYITGGKGAEWVGEQFDEGGLLGDPEGTAANREGRLGAAGQAGSFAGQGEQGFRSLGTEAGLQRKYMEDIARGRESVSAGQLKNALGQNVAGAQAQAAGARPAQGAMASRNAMMSAGRMGAGLAGQQATAGIQERQSAQNALNQMLMEQRRQELQAALQSRQTQIGGYQTPQGPTGQEKQLGFIEAGARYAGGA
jgi:hypothetical protein